MTDDKVTPISVRPTAELMKALDEARGEESRNAWILQAVQQRLDASAPTGRPAEGSQEELTAALKVVKRSKVVSLRRYAYGDISYTAELLRESLRGRKRPKQQCLAGMQHDFLDVKGKSASGLTIKECRNCGVRTIPGDLDGAMLAGPVEPTEAQLDDELLPG